MVVELDDETSLLVQKEARWSVSLVKVHNSALATQYIFEPQVYSRPTPTESLGKS